jgi:hypothetical protein
MLALNVPLAQWRKFEAEGRAGTVWHRGKNTDKTAAAIFAQLSHEEAVALVAREFDSYAADLRLCLRTLCNAGNGSGNVRKGVQRLDRLMGGKLLREEEHTEHFQVKTRDGWKTTKVNPAVAGATRKYGIVKK